MSKYDHADDALDLIKGPKTMTDLSPCPKCPGKGWYWHWSDDKGSYHNIRCDVCYITMDGYISKESAIEAWNTRPTPDNQAALEALGIDERKLNALLVEAKSRELAGNLKGYSSILTADLNGLIFTIETIRAALTASKPVDLEGLKREAIKSINESEEHDKKKGPDHYTESMRRDYCRYKVGAEIAIDHLKANGHITTTDTEEAVRELGLVLKRFYKWTISDCRKTSEIREEARVALTKHAGSIE